MAAPLEITRHLLFQVCADVRLGGKFLHKLLILASSQTAQYSRTKVVLQIFSDSYLTAKACTVCSQTLLAMMLNHRGVFHWTLILF